MARLAGKAHGVVTRAELRAAGVSSGEIKHRLGSGALIARHRGVYRVGHAAASVEATYMAAVKACGEGAALCGRAAGFLLGLLRGRAPRAEVVCARERRVPGLATRRSAIGRRDRTLWRGIRVTSPARTLVDLAATLEAGELALACHEAGVKHGTTPRQVLDVLDRRPNSPGAARLRSIVSGETMVSLSKLESRFLSLLRAEGLPLPVTNRRAGSKRVDCRWPEHRLTVELDSYRYHSSRHAWEADRRREREAYARGDDFRRFVWGDVFETTGPMLAELRGLLADRVV